MAESHSFLLKFLLGGHFDNAQFFLSDALVFMPVDLKGLSNILSARQLGGGEGIGLSVKMKRHACIACYSNTQCRRKKFCIEAGGGSDCRQGRKL